MSKLCFHGPLLLRLSSFALLNKCALETYICRLAGRKMEPTWGVNLEIGVRYVRRQFTRAMNASDMIYGRAIFESLLLETSDVYAVDRIAVEKPKGTWHMPRNRTCKATILYCHGGGYAFHSGVSRRFADMLAHHTGAPLFAPDYRLTPEHPHPAQAEDAFAAWRHVTNTSAPQETVVIGDSAGGHMMLMLLLALKADGHSQPALGIGLCPWTDIGDRGASLHGNDRYDLVQGWMALRFGQWLDPDGRFGRQALSPINHDFTGLAPLYLQIGGRDILYDMTRDFAEKQTSAGAEVMLDVWPTMHHDFQSLDSMHAASTEALERIKSAIRSSDGDAGRFGAGPMTVLG